MGSKSRLIDLQRQEAENVEDFCECVIVILIRVNASNVFHSIKTEKKKKKKKAAKSLAAES